MKATTLHSLTVNIGSDIHNPSGYEPLIIPAGETITVEESTRLSSNVWIYWKFWRGKVECGYVERLIERGLIQAL